MLREQPDEELLKLYFEQLHPSSRVVKDYYKCIHKMKVSKEFVGEIRSLKEKYDFDTVVLVLCNVSHRSENLVTMPEIVDYVKEFMNEIMENGESYKVQEYKHYGILDSTIEGGN